MLEKLLQHGVAGAIIQPTRRRQRLSVMATSVGYEKRVNEVYDWDGLKRGQAPFTIFQHTISGQGRLRFEGRDYVLKAGDSFLLSVPHAHRYWLEENGQWDYFWMSMSGDEALRLHQQIADVSGPVVRLKTATIDRLAAVVLGLMAPDISSGFASSLAYEALMLLYDDVLSTHGTGAEENSMQDVLDHIEMHLAEDLSVQHLARLKAMSRSHFSRAFMRAQGVPPAEYVLERRLMRATLLLTRQNALPIKTIAALCGFEDSNYFAKAFRRFYGTSPSEFRTSGMYGATPPRLQDARSKL